MKSIITALLIVLILISGCARDVIIAKPLSEINTVEIELEANITEAGPCDDVVCGLNSNCDTGLCVCEDGYKQCGDNCISEDSCCTDAECASGSICDSGMCKSTSCNYNEAYDSKNKKCACDSKSKYCAIQKRCIPKTNCCMHVECDSYEACIPTLFMVSVCVNNGKKMCRAVSENRDEYLVVDDMRYYIALENVLQNSNVVLNINEKEFVIAEGEQQKLDNLTLYVEDLTLVGGHCREQ